jgi:DNA-directed RNA polymerase beta subunit
MIFKVGDKEMRLQKTLGNVPVMVKSAVCHLRNMTTEELVKNKEEALEMGGYFIINGNERVVRLLVVPRRNHVGAPVIFLRTLPTFIAVWFFCVCCAVLFCPGLWY